MRRAGETTRLLQRPSTGLLRQEKLLRVAIRRHAANRTVIRHGRDDDVALANVTISLRPVTCMCRGRAS